MTADKGTMPIGSRPSAVSDGDYAGPRTMVQLWAYVAGPTSVVPFTAVVKARRAREAAQLRTNQASDDGNVASLDEAQQLEKALRKAFGEQNGTIVNEYYCPFAVGAAAMTDATDEAYRKREGNQVPPRALHTVLNTSSDLLQSMEARCDTLVNDAVTVFGEPDRNWRQMRYTTDSAYFAMATVLYAADILAEQGRSTPERRAAVIAAARKVQQTTERVQVLVQRHARFSYFVGVLLGSTLALLACVLVGLLLNALWPHLLSIPSLMAATLFGVFGAITSVFQRISTGRLVLDYTAPRGQRLLLGGLRPFIGALFGAVAYFGIVAGLITGGQPQSGAAGASLGFFAVIGFASGFSERFVTDMIERAGQVMAGTAVPAISAPSQPAEDLTELARSGGVDNDLDRAEGNVPEPPVSTSAGGSRLANPGMSVRRRTKRRSTG